MEGEPNWIVHPLKAFARWWSGDAAAEAEYQRFINSPIPANTPIEQIVDGPYWITRTAGSPPVIGVWNGKGFLVHSGETITDCIRLKVLCRIPSAAELAELRAAAKGQKRGDGPT